MLTISILNYRNALATGSLVRQLLGACTNIDYRIVIRDNSEVSELDAIKELIGASSVPIVYSASPCNPGFGSGHNLNFQMFDHREYDNFLILNNDLHIRDPAVIQNMLDQAAAARIVTCTIRSERGGEIWYSGGKFGRVSGDLWISKDELVLPAIETEFVSGCCMLITAELFRALCGFDERFFMYAEDADLSVRARQLGAKILIVNSSIFHDVGSGQKGNYSDLYLYENTKNRLICLRKYRFGLPGVRYLWFIGKYGVLRSVQLACVSRRPIKQIIRTWIGIFDGFVRGA